MIHFYIVHHQLSEAVFLQAYLSTTDFSNNVLVVDEAALLGTHTDQPAAIICSIPSLTNNILKWLKKLHNPPLLICCGTGAEIENIVNTQQVFAYLQTPVSLERVLSLKKNIHDYLFQTAKPELAEKKNFVFVKSDYKLIKINLQEILFLSGLKDYTQVFLKNKKTPLTTLKNLKEFETKLSPNDFVRVHRSYIVAISQIDYISKNEITIESYTIPIGNAFRKVLDEAIGKNS
ncbi:LytR/AlgR family response regulator transcription factor [Parasediminibacterium sp. JCM 36343]|uniref:LytR/AlgR family response regulator transcription factor n=1 Tax=Parasediminibacterium sp. JCM 36343 TaxID=3374279 RepID=UPI00397AC60D